MSISVLEIYFRPPMAIARMGGSDTPLESFVWSEDPTVPGAAKTVIEPALSLEVERDGAIRPFIPGTIRFRDGEHFRPVAPFFELWVRYESSGGVFVGPPDFAPDRRPFVALVDDLADRDLGAPEAVTAADVALSEAEIADLFQRVNETVSLADLDATRGNAIADNATNGVDGFTQPPRTDRQTMTPADAPYADLTTQLVQPPTPQAPLPYADAAQVAHARLSELDDLVAFFGTNGDRVRQMVRRPYGAFRELSENPAATATPDPDHRDPRINRDRAHDMRMPPYMRDSDASALSLSRRQYLQVKALLDFLAPPDAGPAAAAARDVSRAPATAIEPPIRRRVREFIANQARLSGTDGATHPGVRRP